MSDVLSEEEQLQAIKQWWKDNGSQILLIGCLFAASYFGYNWWQDYKEDALNAALQSYDQYQSAYGEATALPSASENQIKTLNYLTDQLIEEHGSTHYAFLASLNTAAFDVRRGELESADARLAWALENVDEEADRLLANYRSALVKAELGQIDEAVSMLSESNAQFASLYAEARGDIRLSQSDSAAAMLDYEEAQEAALEDDVNRVRSLEVKILSLKTSPLAAQEPEEASSEASEESVEADSEESQSAN